MMVILEWGGVVLGVVGVALICLAALGVVVMPDLYTRMQAASKAATLGAACVLLGAAAAFGEGGVAVRALLVVTFLFLTAPVAAHMLARAGYCSGAPLADGTAVDELDACYDPKTHALASAPSVEPPAPATNDDASDANAASTP